MYFDIPGEAPTIGVILRSRGWGAGMMEGKRTATEEQEAKIDGKSDEEERKPLALINKSNFSFLLFFLFTQAYAEMWQQTKQREG